jgi:integrase
MAKIVTPLTDTKIKRAKPKNKLYKLFDGEGLYLEVKPNGTKTFRVKYRFNNKEKTYTIGKYPDITLAEARRELKKVKELLRENIDPVENKKAKLEKEKLLDTLLFKNITDEFFKLKASELSTSHLKRQISRVNIYILPKIGNKNITKITKKDIIEIIKDVKNIKTPTTKNTDKTETAKRIYILLKQIFKFAIHNDYIGKNIPEMIDINTILPKTEKRNLKAITDEKEIKIIYKLLEEYPGYEITKLALKFLALTALRPGNVQKLEVEWIKNNMIVFPANAMKIKKEFRLPLTDTLKNIIQEALKINKKSKYLFPAITDKNKHLSENTLNLAHKRLGIVEHNAHGWRSAFATICYEKQKEHGFSSEVIETQLAHVIGSKVTRAYMRSDFLEERRKLLEWWEKFLTN